MTAQAEPLKDQIARTLSGLDAELLRDSQRILQFETVSGGTPEQEAKYREQIPACLQWLESLATQMGFNFRNWENRAAEIEWPAPRHNGHRVPIFGIASHIDVVTPAGTWSHPPFAGDIADGFLWGRGTQDDKGPLIQALYGMYAVKKAGIQPPCDVRLIIGTSEETGDWSDIALYIERRGAPDFGYTPDADFPIIIGEKGMVNLKVSARWPAVEPNAETQMEFVRLTGGQRSNIIPPLAEVALRFPEAQRHVVMKELVRETTTYTVENPGSNVTLVPNNEKELAARGVYEALISFVGKAAHSSTPDKGHNAIHDALRFFADIETLPSPVRAFIQFLAMASVDDYGTGLQISGEHDFVGRTTAVISLLSIDQTGGSANINIRPTMGLKCTDVLARAQEAARLFGEASGLALHVEVSGGRAVDAVYLDPERPDVGRFLKALQSAYQSATGREPKLVSIGGTTYAKAFPSLCAFGPVEEGVDESMAHQADERLALDSIRRNALIYGLSIALMAEAPAGGK